MKSMKTKQGTELPLLDLRGKPYLQAAHRLVWMREEHPDWSIKTQMLSTSDEKTIFQATVSDGSGNILAMAHGQECKKDFGDHLEKSETKAIARALAMCGYGTQFAPELDEGARIVDSPTDPVKRPQESKAVDKAFSSLKETVTAIQKEFKINEEAEAAGDYTVAFGKYKGTKLSFIPRDALENYIGYLEGTAAKEGKPIRGGTLEFINRAKAYLDASKEGDVPVDGGKGSDSSGFSMD